MIKKTSKKTKNNFDMDRLIARMLTAIAIASTITTAGLGTNMLINKDEMKENTTAQNIAYQTAVTTSGAICASSTAMTITANYMVKRKKEREQELSK